MSKSVIDVLDDRFTSGNKIAVERAHITAEEYASVKRLIEGHEEHNYKLIAAANEVLCAYMPKFDDSRTVDDCLVGLAGAVHDAETDLLRGWLARYT